MARLASAVFALSILLPSGAVRAGDVFTGFQMDDQAQYFVSVGVREELPWSSSGVKGYVQLFAAAQSYEYESGTLAIDADVQFLIPALGIKKSLGGGAWSISAHVGPQLEWKKEAGFPIDSGRRFNVGVAAQAEVMYWQETHSVHGMLSYASRDDFYFGRLRGKVRIHSPGTGCCALFAGMDLAGMGNSDFRAVQIGPLVEVPIGRFSLLARGGYKNDSSFGSGGYGGVEMYAPF